MTYFIDIDESLGWEGLPPEALIVNGVAVDSVVKGFTTLNVKGRETLGKQINTVDVEGRDGALYLGSKRPTRTIIVKYELATDNVRDFRLSYERLNMILDPDQLSIKFRDDLEYTYIATLENMADLPEGTLTLVSEISFLCSDPYKYGEPLIVEADSRVIYLVDTYYKTKPTQISVTPKEDTDTITINSGDKQIQLVEGSFLAGKVVSIDFGEDIKVTSSNGDDTNKVALHSDLEDFFIKKGQPIEFVEGGNLKVTIREVKL